MRSILLVDDSRVTRELMKVYLMARDVTFLEAADGEAALAEARAHRPDLVLADMRMPRLDGAELCAALRADLRTHDIPVLILTSSQDLETARRARAAGAREVLRKPVQPQALLEAVSRHIHAASPAATVGVP